jgi:hypothetical protein
MVATVRRLWWCLATTVVGVGIAVMVVSTANALTFDGKKFQLSFDEGTETSPAVHLATKETTEDFLSVWDEQTPSTVGNEVFGQIFTQSGALVGSEIPVAPLANGAEDTRPRIGYSPKQDTFMVVWEDDRNAATTGEETFAQILTSNGSLAGVNLPIGAAIANQQRPAIAYDSISDRYLVVWADWRNQKTTGVDIYGQIVDSDGTLVGANFPISTARNTQDRARVSFDQIKGQFLVVWSDDRNAKTTGWDIYGQKVGPSGALVGPPIVVSNAEWDQFRPDITWDSNDNEFMAVWVDCRNVGAPACVSGEKTDGDIYGQVILTGGVLSGANFPIATSTASEYRPAVTFSTTSDLFLATYSDQPNNSNTGESQIWGVEVMPNGTLVGTNGLVTITSPTAIEERAGTAYNPNNNTWIVDYVNQVASGAPQFTWGQFLNP